MLGLLFTITQTSTAFGQNALQFTGINVTDEGAMQLHWTSQSNEVYEIDEADALIDTNTGTITWNKLYEEYPSQGTNTFWLDTGNYFRTPAILHPKNIPMRFYRIVDQGPDTSSDEPIVSIGLGTNSTTVSGELTIFVTASTDQPVLSGTKLYVDGQEMRMADSTTNYTDDSGVTNFQVATYSINTSEWPNGSHILFATAKCASDFSGPIRAPAILTGHAVSSFLPVAFNNLITKISFSEPFFDPDAGQTQHVSAVFAANSDWTLQIQDGDSNVVRTATGKGNSMLFNWDGTDSGGTEVQAGIYYYFISAQTNGNSSMNMMSGSASLMSPAAAIPTASNEATELWALPPDSSEPPLPLAMYPPGIDTNGFTIFEATPSEMQALNMAMLAQNRPATTAKSLTLMAGSAGTSFQADDANSDSPPPAAQNSPPAPQRPPTAPKARIAGLFAVAYQDYGFDGINIPHTPLNGLASLHVYIQGSTGNSYCGFVESVSTTDFIAQMARGAWQTSFVKDNGNLHASDLRKESLGGANVFNANNGSLGILSLHGGYGTSQDFDQASGANGAQQIYFPIDGRPNSGPSWVRMSEMDFGSPGTNGLKWMTLMACNSLRQQNWNSIRNAGWKPFNGNLHLLMGGNSLIDDDNLVLWAKFMLGLDLNRKRPIYDAWRDSAPYCRHLPVQFAIAGFDDCKQDMLTGTNSYTPQGSVFYDVLPVAQ